MIYRRAKIKHSRVPGDCSFMRELLRLTPGGRSRRSYPCCYCRCDYSRRCSRHIRSDLRNIKTQVKRMPKVKAGLHIYNRTENNRVVQRSVLRTRSSTGVWVNFEPTGWVGFWTPRRQRPFGVVGYLPHARSKKSKLDIHK